MRAGRASRAGRVLAAAVLGLGLCLVPAASPGGDEPAAPSRGLSRSSARRSGGVDLVRTLRNQFPALRGRMQTPRAFEDATWRSGSRVVRGLVARRVAGETSDENDQQALAVVFPHRASDPVVAEGEGVRVALRPVGARSAPAEIVEGMLTYVDVHEQTDALHIVGEGWTEEYLHLRNEDAPRRFEYELLEARGAGEVRLVDGEVQVLDDEGRGLVILAPVVVDAAGRRSATAAHWELLDGPDDRPRRLVLHLDARGLEYPLVIDPSFATGSMSTARWDPIGILLHTGRVLVMAGGPASQVTAELYDPATGIWSPTSAMGGPGRDSHAAVMLRDGRVLVIGGAGTLVDEDDCRLYDPVTDIWVAAKPLPAGRQHHTATLLGDGRVLVAGGANNSATPHADAWLYDPAADAWTATDPMNIPRGRHGAALLQDGRVLVAGGFTTGPVDTPSAEIYDPGAGTWATVDDMNALRQFFALTVLPDGKVLAAGESGTPTAELYDPAGNAWTNTGALAGPRRYPSATLLPIGKVLLAGGHEADHLDTTEIYDPGTGQWSTGPTLQAKRRRHSATMLPDGRVLIAGGQNPAALATAELIDLDAPAWSDGNAMDAARSEHTLTLLPDGRVLAAGGVASQTAQVRDPSGSWVVAPVTLSVERWRHTATLLHDGRVLLAGTLQSATAGKTAEIFDPGSNLSTPTGDMGSERNWHTATLLPCGEVLVAAGRTAGGLPLASAERYNPRTGSWRPTGDLKTARWRHTATLLRDGRVLVTGGYGSNPLDKAEVYDPVAETWTEITNPMLAGRYYHTATLLPTGRVLLVGGLGAADSAEIFDPLLDTFAPSPGGPVVSRDRGFSATLLPNGRVLLAGGSAAPATSEVYDPARDAWSPGPNMSVGRNEHAAVLLLDGEVLVAGGGNAGTETFAAGRGELPTWRPVVDTVTDPLPWGASLQVTGTGFQGHSEGSTGAGYMQSATNYPLVQLHRLDNDAVEWLPVGENQSWSDVVFDSREVMRPRPGPARVTVFTSGIPSVSKVIALECPPPTVTTSPTDQVACLGGSTTFDVVADAGTCVAWQWRKGGVPIAEGGRFTGTRTATLSIAGMLAADAGSYDAVAEMACGPGTDTSAAATLSLAADLSGLTATPGSPTSVCSTCTGSTVGAAHLDGGPVTHQWGYRTTSLGPIVDMPGRTSATYQINGADFPGVGSYFLVVQATPTCGTAQVSNEIQVDVVAAAPGDDVVFLTVTSRDSENVLEWVNPPGYDTVRIRYNLGTPCTYPADADNDGVLVVDKAGLPGQRDRFPHGGLVNDTTYCYTLFVDTGGTHSTGRSNHGRPFATSGPVKWAFSTGVLSLTAPTVGGAGVIATSNDNVLHAMKRGLAGGEWPAGWRPVLLGGPVQSRSPVIPIDVNGSNPVAFLGSQDGTVSVVDAAVGGAAPLTWSPVPIASGVQAAPAGIFTAFGGAYDYLIAGTRNAAGDNSLVALDPADGSILEVFDNGGGAGNRIGIISGMPSIDYPSKRVYFTSYEGVGGSAATLWALQLGASPIFSQGWATQRPLGDIASSPVLMGDRVYVGGPAGLGTVYSIDAATGAPGLDRSLLLADGPVKGFMFPDRANDDLWFATDSVIWGVHDDGSSLTVKYGAGLILDTGVTPTSPVLFIPGSHYVYVGGSDGKLYELDTLGPSLRSVTLGDGQAAVGAPSLDWPNGLIHVGTEAGIFYAVQFPLP